MMTAHALSHALGYAAWLVHHGYMNRATVGLRQLLYVWRDHPHAVALIHHAMYAIHPDWGL